LVGNLSGLEKEVAVQSYEEAVKTLFLAGSVLAFVMTALQAGTGWTPPDYHSEEVYNPEDDLIRESDEA
jgi:hypothetical protein